MSEDTQRPQPDERGTQADEKPAESRRKALGDLTAALGSESVRRT